MTGGSRAVLSGHTEWVDEVAIAPDGTWLVTGSHDDYTVRIWDAASGAHRTTLTAGGPGSPITGLAVAPDSTWLATTNVEGGGQIWDAANGRQRAMLTGHKGGAYGFVGVHGVAISPDGTWVATSGNDGTARIWDPVTGAQLAVLGGHEHKVHGVALAISPDATWLAATGVDTVGIWAVGTRSGLLGGSKLTAKLRTTLTGHRSQVRAVAVSPDGTWVVTTSRDGTARIWDPATGRQRATLTGHTGMVNFVAVSPDGRWLATTGDDETVRVWETATGTQRASLPAEAGFATQVAIAPDGTWFATTSHKSGVGIWDPVTGSGRATLNGHTDAVNAVAIAPDGTWLATASSDHTARIWPSPGPSRGRPDPAQGLELSVPPNPLPPALSQPDADTEAYFERGTARSRVGDLDTAAELFRQASDRGHALAAYALAALLKDRGQLAEAETQYRRALASGLPPDPPRLIADCEASLGYIRAQMDDDEEAERLYRAADARGYLDATFNLGNLLSRKGRTREAEEAWRRAAAAGQADAAYNLAELVGDRGELEEAERLLRHALAAGITDAINNLAKVRLQRGDPVEAEILLRQAVAAGDHNAVFNLGIVLNVLGKLDEAEAVLRQAAAAGHPEAPAHVERLVAARAAGGAPGQGVTAGQPEPGPTSNSTVDKRAFGDLGMLFAKDSSNADRMRAVRDFGTAARVRLSSAVGAAEQGRDVLAERSAQLLSEVAARLPIRTADTLYRQYGNDPEKQSQHVIAEAGRLAGWLWTAAAAIPGPPPIVQAIKVVVHSAIEIRMIGELYAIHGNGADRDATWLGTVLLAWASGRPVAPGGSLAATTAVLVTKMRGTASELVGTHSRAATVASRGREGADTMLRTGARMHRRMRLHPSTWAQPGSQPTGAALIDTVGKVAADKLTGRVPQALLSAARDRMTPSIPPAASQEPPVAVATSTPRETLAEAWALHQQAAVAASAVSTSDAVGTRLSAALAAQERHLQVLGRRLGQSRPPVPTQRRGDGGGEAARLVWDAEAAIDVVEETGARSRRLPSWSTRRRAALVYLITALIVSAMPAVILLGSAGFGMVGILLAQCLALPWLSLAAGAIAIGPLFRPWLGGPVPRHPVTGTWIVLGVHVGLGALAAVVGMLT